MSYLTMMRVLDQLKLELRKLCYELPESHHKRHVRRSLRKVYDLSRQLSQVYAVERSESE